MPPFKLTFSSSADFQSFIQYIHSGFQTRGRQGEEQKYRPSTVCWDLLGYQMVAWPTWGEQAQHWASVVPFWESWEARRLASSWIPAKRPINAARSQWKEESQLLFSVHPSVSLQSILEIIHYCCLISPFVFKPVFLPNLHSTNANLLSLGFLLVSPPHGLAGVSSGGRGRDTWLISVAHPIPHWMK